MHEKGPFFVNNGILFINGTQVHDLASVLDTTTGELLACGDYNMIICSKCFLMLLSGILAADNANMHTL